MDDESPLQGAETTERDYLTLRGRIETSTSMILGLHQAHNRTVFEMTIACAGGHSCQRFNYNL